MQYIRKIESSVSKLAYPSGVSQPLGTLSLANTPKITDVTSLGYNDNNIFSVDDANPSRWSFSNGVFISKSTLRNGKPFGKMVSVQKRFSNDGTIFPPSVNKYLGAVYYNNSNAQRSLQHRLNIIRNATTYSPVQELAVFQAIVTPNRVDLTPDLGIRIDKDIATVAGLDTIYVKPSMEDKLPYNPNIVGVNRLSARGLNASKQTFTQRYTNELGNVAVGADWLKILSTNVPNTPTRLTGYRDDAKAYYARFCRQFIAIDLLDIDVWKTKLKYISIHNYAGITAEGEFNLPVTQEMIDACVNAAAKGYKYVGITVVTMTGQLYDNAVPTIDKDKYLIAGLYRNDIVKDSLEIDPNGDWIKFELARPGKYTVWFDNEVYAFEKMATDVHVTINKTTKKFTSGGLLEINLIGYQDSNYTSNALTYTIPDTIPPNPPTIISYAADAVYGTANSGDKVVVERDNVIIGQGNATSTNTFEVNIPAADLENGQIVQVYTEDVAGNKSAKIEGTVVDIISNLRYNVSDLVNSIRMSP